MTDNVGMGINEGVEACMLTKSADELVTVQVTPRKWSRGVSGSGPWKWEGYLGDVEANAVGVCVYHVRERQWIDVHLMNMGVEPVLHGLV